MGLQICNSPSEITAAFESVTARSASLFSTSSMFMERYIPRSRHVEVQVFGNGLGQAVHFNERECSIQRRHQKVVEECPSPFVHRRQGRSGSGVDVLHWLNVASAHFAPAPFRNAQALDGLRSLTCERCGIW